MKVTPNQRRALELVAAGAFYPDLVREEGGWCARWRPTQPCEDSVADWLDQYVRTAAMTAISAEAEKRSHPTLHDAWSMALKSRTGLVKWDDRECVAFAETLYAWHENAKDSAEVRRGIVFTFDADASTVSCAVPRGRDALRALGEAVVAFGPLRGLRAGGRGRQQAYDSKEAGGKACCRTLVVELTRDEAAMFLASGARALTKAGYGVAGCDLAVAITASAEIGAPADTGKTEDVKLVIKVAGQPVTANEIRFLLEQKSSLVFFREHWIEVDRNILKEALRALEKSGQCKLSRMQALAFAFGIGHIGKLELEEVAAHGWLRGLLNEMRQARGAGEKQQAYNSKLGAGEGLGKQQAYNSKKEQQAYNSKLGAVEGLKGTLRDYQARGVAWLSFLTDHGFGALLADDMGLGKTIQAIAWVLVHRALCLVPCATATRSTKHKAQSTKQGPVLIVAPLTLLSNWRHEFATFAPDLKVYVHQGHDRHVASGFLRAARESDVVLTSYNLLVKDHLQFGEIAWDALILDEAQTIKNPDTAVARAVRALTPPKRIALTGTPIENSVEDVWSIEEFLNPGFLGPRKEFTERFVKPLRLDPHARVGARLRHALEPFVLRRLKSDKGVAAELGPKREIREYCELTLRGRADYEAALADYRASTRRRGDVFALLTRLKLICDGAGKFERLAELLEQIYANGESALVFTQYAKVGRELRQKLEERFGTPVSFLHGALTAKQREREISDFNKRAKPSAFILSLRAGGFGLNLTKATHVIHYDRWWNPAVENQATDRAHRIGQHQTVLVHLLMTAGTVEEHVDEILTHKTAISGGLVASGEAFLSQLPPELFDKAVALDE